MSTKVRLVASFIRTFGTRINFVAGMSAYVTLKIGTTDRQPAEGAGGMGSTTKLDAFSVR